MTGQGIIREMFRNYVIVFGFKLYFLSYEYWVLSPSPQQGTNDQKTIEQFYLYVVVIGNLNNSFEIQTLFVPLYSVTFGENSVEVCTVSDESKLTITVR